MAQDANGDKLAIIKIVGMHCHKCEQAIRKAMQRIPGVHEAEVDFNSGQASVLFDGKASIRQLMDAVRDAGYQPTEFSQQSADSLRPS